MNFNGMSIEQLDAAYREIVQLLETVKNGEELKNLHMLLDQIDLEILAGANNLN